MRIQGVLLHQQPGKRLFIRDDSGCISVSVDHLLPVNSSDLLSVSGYIVPEDFAPAVEYAVVKRIGSRPLPEPRILSDGQALNNNFHGDLVKIRAKLVDQWLSSDGKRFLLQDLSNTGITFESLLENGSNQAKPPIIRNGSELELTGIYLLQEKETQPYRLLLLLRTPEDINILKRAPWWTVKHTYWSFGILLFLIASALTWAAMLKRRVRQQTDIIRHRIEAEAALEKKYRELCERSNDIVFACDQAGRLKSINPAGMQILGYENQELIEMDPSQLLGAASLPKIEKWIENRLNAIDVPHLECELLAKDGRLVHVEVNAEIIFADGKPSGAQGIARDITERKLAEETLRRSEERLSQGQKIEAIGRLAGGIAHDFNKILSAILGYAELSAAEVPENHSVKDNLSQIIRATKRARDVVQQILAFSRKLDQERQPLHLQTIVDEVLILLKATLPSTILIRTELDPHCGAVMANPTQMHQVILNLATNASHAMREKGGLLRISLAPISLNGNSASHPHDLASGRYARLSVCDTGHGIEPEIQRHIFEPYFTTKSAGQGSGLGLAVVHGIIQSHGGAITVESTPGDGATFQIYLPCCEDMPAKRVGPPTEISEGQGNILMVDDEEAIVNLCTIFLEKMGYRVTGTTSSVQALEMFQKNPDQFNLVVTDQTMPNITGMSLAQELWKVRPGLPVIIASGYSEQITSEKAAGLGFLAYLNKPYTVAELAGTVSKAFKN